MNKKYTCNDCNKKFTTAKYLVKHIALTCKFNKNELKNNIKENTEDNTEDNIANNIEDNTEDNIEDNIEDYKEDNIANNIEDNTEDNIDIIPINDEWIIDHLNLCDIIEILKNDYIFTNTLKKILENKKNLNALIIHNDENCYIYMNCKLNSINLENFVNIIMRKIYEIIWKICEEKYKDYIIEENIVLNALDNLQYKYNIYRFTNDRELKTDYMALIIEKYYNKRTITDRLINKALKNAKKNNGF